ncbi:hypothetical protein TNCV_4705111 [Trichonephila clavipes]|nr:hypothetical protein TNCV_4705111 [Trichonephila clavipes]
MQKETIPLNTGKELWKTPKGEKIGKFSEIGNVIEKAVDLATKINLEVDRDGIQELLDSHYQELTTDEFIEIQEQDIVELESIDPVQSNYGWEFDRKPQLNCKRANVRETTDFSLNE